jgi:hypothetical protein
VTRALGLAATVLFVALTAAIAEGKEALDIDQKVTRPPGVAVSVTVVRTNTTSDRDVPATVAPLGEHAAASGITTRESFSPAAAAGFDPQPCLRRRIGGSWGSTLSFCVAAPGQPARPGSRGPSVSPEQVARMLADHALARAPDPRIHVAPATAGVTGLTSYFWVEPARPITATAAVGSVIVTAEARPVQYVWSFGDGAELATSDPGTPWRPRRAGSIGHTYEARAVYRLSVEQLWVARWRAGPGPWRQLGYFSNSVSRSYPVRQVVALLVPPR